jgi:putative ABC transport system permease protein
MRALDRKLFRDLWKTKGQVLAIILVIASGISTFVMLRSTMNSLDITQKRFYDDYGFAQVFATLKRAPESLKERISAIPGVDQVQTRVVADVKLRVEGFDEPVTGRIVSIPESNETFLNRISIKKGRNVAPGKEDEVVLSEAFSEAHRLNPGDRIGAIINGKWKQLTIVGTALCPEFVLPTRPGSVFPDFKRYAILWMGRPTLATAYNMKGAFNDVIMTLSDESAGASVINQIDSLLSWYGGIGAYERKDQISHRFLSEEFKQLRTTSTVFPAIFISVATFLLYVVMSRTVSTQRDQIAALKAFGYSSSDVAVHYIKSLFLITLFGVAGGIAIGAWFGKNLANMYMEFYRFPYLNYELKVSVVLTAVAISTASALIGTLHSVWQASSLPPAEAMRPEAPAKFRKSVLEHLRLWSLLSQSTRIIIRNIERRPIRSLMSIIGISLSCGAMISATYFTDAMDYLIDVQFTQSQKEDMTAAFIEPTSRKAIHELQGIEGVQFVEPFRTVMVRLKSGHKSYQTTIEGIERNSRLRLLLDTNLQQISVPPEGIMLSDYLRDLLQVKPQDRVTVEILEGSKPTRFIPVVGFFEQYIGVGSSMDLDALNHLMKEDQAISGAHFTVDNVFQKSIYNKLTEMPRVAGTLVRKDEINNFYQTQAEMFLFFTFIASILAGTIAFGVVYNNARISLSERSRELASLRVLGYTKSEISFIFLGELAMLTLIAIPLGFTIGKAMASFLAVAVSSDLFRIPVIIEKSTYSMAATVVIVSACISGFIVRHRLDHLDLVAVLKTKE